MKTFTKWVGLIGLPALILALFVAPAAHALSVLGGTTPPVLAIGATIGASVTTLLDWAKRLDPDGGTSAVAELLSQSNEVLEDMQFKEGNLPVGERVSVRTGLPTVAWRLLNQGVAKSKSTTAQIDEACGILEARSEIDKDLADLNGNTGAFRLSEAQAFIESMNETFADTLFYGNSGVDPEKFTGLSIRYSDTTAKNGTNIIKAGGSGSVNSSIWLVCWGPNTVYGIFPKGSKAGLVHDDLGEGDAFDSSNNRFRAYMDRYQWKGGIALKDWRYVVRICNIDITNLKADAAGATVKLIEYMGKSLDRIPNAGMGRMVFYTNRTVKSMLRLQALNKSIANLGVEPAINQFGKNIYQLTFLGVPVRTVDRLIETEATVS
jgi:hypothetical protein